MFQTSRQPRGLGWHVTSPRCPIDARLAAASCCPCGFTILDLFLNPGHDPHLLISRSLVRRLRPQKTKITIVSESLSNRKSNFISSTHSKPVNAHLYAYMLRESPQRLTSSIPHYLYPFRSQAGGRHEDMFHCFALCLRHCMSFCISRQSLVATALQTLFSKDLEVPFRVESLFMLCPTFTCWPPESSSSLTLSLSYSARGKAKDDIEAFSTYSLELLQINPTVQDLRASHFLLVICQLILTVVCSYRLVGSLARLTMTRKGISSSVQHHLSL